MLRISYKKASVVTMLLMMALGGAGIYFATQFRVTPGAGFFSGPKFYPMMLCAAMIVIAAVELVKAIAKPNDRVIEIPNFKNYLLILGGIIAWVLLWLYVLGFFLSGLICSFVLLFFLNPEPFSWKKLLNTAIIDAAIMGVFYLLFDVAFGMGL